MKLQINQSGDITAIYSPESARLLKAVGSSMSIQRASHVEPGGGLPDSIKSVLKYQNRWPEDAHTKWYADLGPIGYGVLGPFETNAAAIAAEVEFINEHLSEITHDCTN